MKKIESKTKKTNEVWDKTLYVDTLSEFKPVRDEAFEYQFTLAGSGNVEDQTVRLFNFDIPPRGAWSVEMVVKEGNKPLSHNIVYPQRQVDWQRLLKDSGVIPSEAERFMHALIHSYNKAQKAVKGLCFEDLSGEESLDLENHPLPKQIEIVPNFAMQGGYTILFGEAGVGKSILAHNIGLRAASGIRSLDIEEQRDPIVVHYLSLEMSSVQFRERHNKLLESFPVSARKNFFFICPESLDFTNPRDKSMLQNTLARRGTKLLIVDCHSYWLGNHEESNNSEINNYIVNPLKELASKLELSIILLHHAGWDKTDRIRGASSLWNGAEIGILMESDPGDTNQTTITFKKWRPTSKRKPRPVSYAYDPEKYVMRVSGEAGYINGLKPALPPDFKRQIMELTGVLIRQARNKYKTLMAQDYIYLDEKGIVRIRDYADADNREQPTVTKENSRKKPGKSKRR